MILSEIIRNVGEFANPSPKVAEEIKSFVNRAMRQLAWENDFTYCHDRRPYVILSGQTSVSLGPDFKRLSDEESPISVSYASGNETFNLPVRVLSREEVERQLYWPWIGQYLNQPTPGGYIPIRVVFLERNTTGSYGAGGSQGQLAGTWNLCIPPQFNVESTNSPYNVSGFYIPKPLVLGTDNNPITDDPDAAEAIIQRAVAMSIAAENPTHPRVKAAKEMADEFYTNAKYTDGFVKYSGRTLRM